jgi:hypothetical protein
MKALGAYAKSRGINQLVATGTAAPIAEGFGTGSFYAETIEETVSLLSQMVAHTGIPVFNPSIHFGCINCFDCSLVCRPMGDSIA